MMHEKDQEEQAIKRMASLLRQGLTLTELACPACSSPLFRVKSGELWCEKCQKKVIVVKEGEEMSRVTSSMALEKLEDTLLSKIQEIQNKMQQTTDVEELQKLSTALSNLLESLEKIRRAKKV
ncbi:MAG: hypothetical protein N3F10_07290 [Candidatus Bathyarchaeota archaeon]|nr:hypothetical protein [Candidatus Bathyarchaeota archaeon]MCX8178077.1 hypothetical protein [Candidatus Bathyarchaeota archaeon]MDW8194502.1 Sjogren's syndrome/scleroderma autoantigen 1 family protein [Nitrososphaerota archaeon]